jgi:hypothetical protein
MNINPVLQTIMDMAGQTLAVIRASAEVGRVSGLKNQDPNTGRKYIALFPGSDVAAGDTLVDLKTEEEFIVVATEHEYVDGMWFQDRAYYGSVEETSSLMEELTSPPEEEDWSEEYLNYIHSLIKVKAAGPLPEYESFLAEFEKILKAKEIKPGSLSGFRAMLEEKEWLANAVGMVLTNWISRN